MIHLMASLIVFVAATLLVLAGFLTGDMPTRFFHWITNTGFAHWPRLQAIADWFLFPTLLIVLYVVLVGGMRLVLGSPRKIMRQYDWPLKPASPLQGFDKFRYGIWSDLFELWVFRKDSDWPCPFRYYLAMVLAAAAFIACAVVLGVFPAFVHPGGSHPSLLVSAFLVFLGMRAAHRDVAYRISEIEAKSAIINPAPLAPAVVGKDALCRTDVPKPDGVKAQANLGEKAITADSASCGSAGIVPRKRG